MSAAILCDLCKQEITGTATEVRLVRAVAGTSTHGKPYLAPREDQVQVQITCTSCSRWIEEAILQLRGSYRAG